MESEVKVLFLHPLRNGEVLEWLKRHAWKACSRQNWLAGSNPVLSALIIVLMTIGLLMPQTANAQDKTPQDTVIVTDADAVVVDSIAMADSIATEAMLTDDPEAEEEGGFHKQLKTKFIDGNVGFMSLVALALVLGLAFCMERIIYLTLSEIKSYKLLEDIEKHLKQNDVEGAKTLCRNTRGPVASVCYQGLLHIHQSCHGTFAGILGNGDWYGNGLRSDSAGRRHRSYHRGTGYEGGADYYDLRYRGGADSAVVL